MIYLANEELDGKIAGNRTFNQTARDFLLDQFDIKYDKIISVKEAHEFRKTSMIVNNMNILSINGPQKRNLYVLGYHLNSTLFA